MQCIRTTWTVSIDPRVLSLCILKIRSRCRVKYFHGFPQSLKQAVDTVLQIRLQSLPFLSFAILQSSYHSTLFSVNYGVRLSLKDS
jgi:hypothetical protein